MKHRNLAFLLIFGAAALLSAADKPADAVKANENAIRAADQRGDYDTVKSLLESMIADASLAPADRVNALKNYYYRSQKRTGGDAVKAGEFIEVLSKLDGLTDKACDQLMQVRIDKAGNEGKKELREELLRTAVASDKIPLARRCELSYDLAVAYLLRTDDIPGAVKIVEDLSKLPGMKEEGDLFAAYKALGDLQRLVGNQKKAIAAYEKIYELAPSPRYNNSAAKLVYECYLAFGEPQKAKDHFMQHGDIVGKAQLDRDYALKMLGDEKADLPTRQKLFEIFCHNTPEDAAVRAKFAAVAKDRNLSMIAAFRGRGSGSGAGNDNSLGVGSYEYALEILGYGEASSAAKTFQFAKYKIEALAGLNRYTDLKKYTQEFRAMTNVTLNTETKYLLDLVDAVIELPDQPGVAKAAIDKVDASREEYKALAVPQEDAPAKRPRSKHSAMPQAAPKKGDILVELASIISHSRKNDLARDIYGLYEAMFVPQPRKEGDVTFVAKPLLGIGDFLAVKDTIKPYLLDRKYGANLENLIATDINAGAARGAVIGAQGSEVEPTKFYPVCDVNGFHIFFDNPDPDGNELASGMASRGYTYEFYFAPGWNQPEVSPGRGYGASSSSWQYQTTYNNITYRRFLENSPEFKHECLYYAKGFYAHYFFAWDNLYNKLPDTPEAFYEFDTINWSPNGGYAWSTRLNVHSRLEWGRLHFRLTPDQLKQIKQQVIFHARKEYLASKSQFNGPVDFWTDAVIGDPEFYQAQVKPLVEKLDAFLPMVTVAMSDADVDKVFQEAVPGWKELGYLVAARRAKYLKDKLTE